MNNRKSRIIRVDTTKDSMNNSDAFPLSNVRHLKVRYLISYDIKVVQAYTLQFYSLSDNLIPKG